MRYALLDEERNITNVIQIESELAPMFDAHYLGDVRLDIGDRYPERDIHPYEPPTETQLLGQQITDGQLERIQMGQAYTDLELAILGG